MMAATDNAADPHELSRFLAAQDGAYERALEELRSGRKRSHWMWFVFPQIDGLGSSSMARRYAIHSLAEARAYLEHPVLGARIVDCTNAVNEVQGRTLLQIFGAPDDLKFCSSMTLFERVGGSASPFAIALNKYCSGTRDEATLGLLRGSNTCEDSAEK